MDTVREETLTQPTTEMSYKENTMKDVIQNLADTLNLTFEQAESLVKQEIARKAASERYRTSQAYKDRLALQKQVRAALKGVEV